MDAPPVSRRNLVVIGASAGGVEALRQVISRLPADLPAAVCVVLHISPTSPSLLAGILNRAGRLPCHAAVDGEQLVPGTVVVAPPDRHLAIEDGSLRVTTGPRENGHRPSIDVLFRSASAARDGHVVGVVLSGTRDDGAAGLALIKANGGAAVVQDPDDAMYPGMPMNALALVAADAVAPLREIGDVVAGIVRDAPSAARVALAQQQPPMQPDEKTMISVCPECGGALTEQEEAGVLRWRCHVGHVYSPDSLLDEQGSAVEAALWTAATMLSDRGALLRRLADEASSRERTAVASTLHQRAEEADDQARLMRALLETAAATSLQRASDPSAEDAA